jgi:hypothetical protein
MSTAHRTAPLYLGLAVVGYLAPGIPMLQESVLTGNALFWADPARTLHELFVNRTSTAFALDLAGVVVAALVFMTIEARRLHLRGIWRYWLLTALFGIGGTLPLFLWSRERALARLAPLAQPDGPDSMVSRPA